MNTLRQLAAVAAFAAVVPAVQAQTFDCITNNSAGSCAQAEATLSWTFDGTFFTISNAVGGGYVAEVYFDTYGDVDVSFVGGTGTVSFSEGASPGALPGGNDVGFVSDFAFDSDAPGGPPVNGINGGESATFQVLGGLADDFDLGALVAGVHVRSLVNGESEGLVTNGPPPPIPEPSTYALMLAGLGVVGWMARRRRPV